MIEIPKSALKNPNGWLDNLLKEGKYSNAVGCLFIKYTHQLDSLVDEINELKKSRNITSRKIGQAKSAKLDSSHLVHKTKSITQNIKKCEQTLIGVLKNIIDRANTQYAKDCTTNAEVISTTDVPAYFDHKEIIETQGTITCVLAQDSADHEAYINYVTAHPARTAYHRHDFGPLIHATTGQQCKYLLAKNKVGKVCGALPITILSSKLFGTYMVSIPWFNYGGPLSNTKEIGGLLMHEACNIAKTYQCSYAQFRETVERSDWRELNHKVSMTLALPENSESFNRNIKSSIRAQSNKAVRAGCIIQFGHEELLTDFYSVFSNKMRSLGTPVHRLSFFSKILNLLSHDATICVVKYKSKPVAAGFLIAHGATQEVPWSSSLRRYDSMGVNMLLYRSILEKAADDGFKYFDFGRSTLDSPTYRFKKQWGAQPQPLYWHTWSDDGDSSDLSPTNPKYRIAIALWKRLPVWATVLLGPWVIRGLP